MDGWFGPGAEVSYEVYDPTDVLKGGGQGTARGDGWMDGVGCNCDMLPGDRVEVSSDAGFAATLPITAISGAFNFGADTLSGAVAGASGGKVSVDFYNLGRPDDWHGETPLGGGGSYVVDSTSDGYDLRQGDAAEVWYIRPDGNQVGRDIYTLSIGVGPSDDWVGVSTAASATVTIVVVGKATYTGQADVNGDLWTGNDESLWTPAKPDIVFGDLVNVSAAGLTGTVNPVGQITATPGFAANTVSGSFTAPFAGPLHLSGAAGGPNGTARLSSWLAPGPYSFDFDDAGYDLAPGDRVAVRYWEPDGDLVYFGFDARAVYLPLLGR